MIRVLQVLPRLRRGGSQAFVMNLYRNIDRTKVQFDFIIFTNDRDDYYDEIYSLGGKVYHFEKFNGKNYFRIRKSFNSFLENHPEYDIIHIHVYSTASIYLPIAKKHGLKTIIHSHSTSNGNGFLSLIKNIMQLPLRKEADYLFACSTDAGKWLFGKKAIHKQNYRFIPNGIDLKCFNYDPYARDDLRKKLGVSDNFVVGHVGGFETPKNHPFIIKVFKKLYEVNQNARLLLVGDGTYEESIKRMVKEYDLDKAVIFAGLQSNVAPFLFAMDVFFFPSLWEGLPVSVVEAQASGLPCILSSSITKDVAITDLVLYSDLKADISNWVHELAKFSERKRATLSKFNFESISTFDIANVSLNLVSFYLSLHDKK